LICLVGAVIAKKVPKCKIFGWIKRKDPKYCPGGVCEMQIKDPIQRFSPAQKSIFIITAAVMLYGTYAYFST